MAGALSATGTKRLAKFEQIIETGLATFQKVGDALLAIRDEKLYRAEFDTFEGYCKARWNISDRRARQLMTAAEIGTVVPVDNEAQARALAPIKTDPDAMRQVVDQAEADGDKSARNLSKYVKNFAHADDDLPLEPVEAPVQIPSEPRSSESLRVEGSSGASPITPDSVTVPCPHCKGTGQVTVRAS